MGTHGLKRLRQLAFAIAVIFGSCCAFPLKQNVQAAGEQTSSTEGIDWSIFLPAGDGQFQTTVYCANCHDLERTVKRRSDQAGWQSLVQTMVFMNGAAIEKDDMDAITKYLSQSFTPTTPALDVPINVNTAPKEVLSLMAGLSTADIDRIVDSRSKAKLKDFAALQAIVTNTNLIKYKSVVTF